MESLAYYLALMMIVISPPMICMWFIIHPFAGFWRRKGPVCTYSVVGTFITTGMLLIYLFRAPLLAVHYGVNPCLVGLSAFLFLCMLLIGIQLRRHLSMSTMFGLPEVSDHEGKLLAEGIYARIRHPRYLEVGFGVAAIALFCNYLAVYILFFLYIPFIYLVILLEEKELKERFGEKYLEYAKSVPRFIPGMKRRS